jgi:hypothetical protein
MSFGEGIYLAGVMFMFITFMAVVGTLSWLDAKDARVQRRREKAQQASHEPGTFVTGATAHR